MTDPSKAIKSTMGIFTGLLPAMIAGNEEPAPEQPAIAPPPAPSARPAIAPGSKPSAKPRRPTFLSSAAAPPMSGGSGGKSLLGQ